MHRFTGIQSYSYTEQGKVEADVDRMTVTDQTGDPPVQKAAHQLTYNRLSYVCSMSKGPVLKCPTLYLKLVFAIATIVGWEKQNEGLHDRKTEHFKRSVIDITHRLSRITSVRSTGHNLKVYHFDILSRRRFRYTF